MTALGSFSRSRMDLRHLLGHLLVTVERGPPVRPAAPRARFAHVVQQRGEAQDQRFRGGGVAGVQGVPEHVVAVQAALGHAVSLQQLGKDDGEDAGLLHEAQAHRGNRRLQDLQDLVPDSLRGDLCQDVEARRDGLERRPHPR